jgi:rubredoxin
MSETTNDLHIARRPRMATRRTLIWTEQSRFQRWACSECAWVFNPSGPLTSNSLQEMKDDYQRLRDKEFSARVCVEHPGTKKANA